MTGAQIWQAFELAGQPPPAAGVFANQPSPYRGQVKVACGASCMNLLSAVVLLAMLVYVFAGEESVFQQSLQLHRRAQAPRRPSSPTRSN